MLDTCPAAYSCGTEFAYWTDAVAPPTVGVAVKSSMYVKSPSKNGSCKNGVYGLSVMRCSERQDDLIYYSHFADELGKAVSDPCSGGFCGMN